MSIKVFLHMTKFGFIGLGHIVDVQLATLEKVETLQLSLIKKLGVYSFLTSPFYAVRNEEEELGDLAASIELLDFEKSTQAVARILNN